MLTIIFGKKTEDNAFFHIQNNYQILAHAHSSLDL